MRRSSLAVAAGATAIVAAGLAITPPATAATSGTTSVTFTLTGGTLDIAVPGPTEVNLGSFAVTTPTVSGPLGNVTVTDSRGLASATWIASVASSALAGSGAAAGVTIPASAIAYAPGTITASNVSTTGSDVAALSGTAQTAVTATAGTGLNTATWNPTLTVTIPPASAVAGTFTATVTHSVA
ncbi:hypothetical protein Ga0074812_106183 [Parafrankia irregularis]|uniref:WxL domain surface cell wall-binding n=1 Tax=Parafrankia irregularis TaxID=795642 RepID=A0A0S4QM26_9ACTN|nr:MULTISPECIES: hypothetical protein [Parafrankia]MBE3202144.1 hypothetical protein [Parafrankia sp. CH37]CUU55928.1 hypothetical protein Ga0074812_106183 [Parafrankia irregularis]